MPLNISKPSLAKLKKTAYKHCTDLIGVVQLDKVQHLWLPAAGDPGYVNWMDKLLQKLAI